MLNSVELLPTTSAENGFWHTEIVEEHYCVYHQSDQESTFYIVHGVFADSKIVSYTCLLSVYAFCFSDKALRRKEPQYRRHVVTP